jgi:hypothetical protein
MLRSALTRFSECLQGRAVRNSLDPEAVKSTLLSLLDVATLATQTFACQLKTTPVSKVTNLASDRHD